MDYWVIDNKIFRRRYYDGNLYRENVYWEIYLGIRDCGVFGKGKIESYIVIEFLENFLGFFEVKIIF